MADTDGSIEDRGETGQLILPENDDAVDLQVLEGSTIIAALEDKPRRFLSPGSVSDLYDTYCQFERGNAVSESTFDVSSSFGFVV